jgi:hypothetical protein
MSLSNIVRVLGGDLYDGGRRANIPAPGHSAADRSVSLLLRNDRVFVHTFGDSDWREVLDDLRARRLIDDRNAPTSMALAPLERNVRPAATDIERLDTARRFWDAGRPLARTLSERHCRLRAIRRPLPGPEVARHSSATPVSAYVESKYRRPTLLVAICDGDGAFSAVEVTYLKANGQRASDLRLPRKTIGPVPANTAIRIDPPAAEMVVGEGFFTTLSATERFQLPGWALMSTRNLRTWIPPEGVRSVLIAADRGKDGEASAAQLAGRLREHRVRARVALPPQPLGDWNDWADAQDRGRGRQQRTKEGLGGCA